MSSQRGKWWSIRATEYSRRGFLTRLRRAWRASLAGLRERLCSAPVRRGGNALRTDGALPRQAAPPLRRTVAPSPSAASSLQKDCRRFLIEPHICDCGCPPVRTHRFLCLQITLPSRHSLSPISSFPVLSLRPRRKPRQVIIRRAERYDGEGNLYFKHAA